MGFPGGPTAPQKTGQNYYVPSSTVRYSDPTDRVLPASPTIMLVGKFLPRYLGDVTIDCELQAAGGANSASFAIKTATIGTAATNIGIDFRTPVGTNVSTAGTDSIAAGSATNASFTKVSITFTITQLVPIYITATSSVGPNFRIRNLNISYDVVEGGRFLL